MSDRAQVSSLPPFHFSHATLAMGKVTHHALEQDLHGNVAFSIRCTLTRGPSPDPCMSVRREELVVTAAAIK